MNQDFDIENASKKELLSFLLANATKEFIFSKNLRGTEANVLKRTSKPQLELYCQELLPQPQPQPIEPTQPTNTNTNPISLPASVQFFTIFSIEELLFTILSFLPSIEAIVLCTKTMLLKLSRYKSPWKEMGINIVTLISKTRIKK